MAKQKSTPSYLVGRTRNRAGIDFATSDGQAIEEIQEEVQLTSDFHAIPLTPLELIDPNPFQYRKKMNPRKLEELKNELRRGINSVIVGRRHPQNPERIQIAYGHRRCEATRQLHAEGLEGFAGYPILVKDLTDEQMRLLPISENRFREDPSLVDEAYAFKSLIEYGFTQEAAAEYYGISRGTFREILALTEDEPDIQEMVEAKSDTLRAARDIRKITDSEIRAQVISDLLNGNITGTQAPSHIETLQQAKLKRLREEQKTQEQATKVLLQDREPPSTSAPVSTTPRENEAKQDSHQTAASGAHPVTSLTDTTISEVHTAETPAPTHTKREPTLYRETQQKSATLTEQSRLRTWCKNVDDYGKRLDKRIQDQEPILEEEVELLQRLYQLTMSQVEKLTHAEHQ